MHLFDSLAPLYSLSCFSSFRSIDSQSGHGPAKLKFEKLFLKSWSDLIGGGVISIGDSIASEPIEPVEYWIRQNKTFLKVIASKYIEHIGPQDKSSHCTKYYKA